MSELSRFITLSIYLCILSILWKPWQVGMKNWSLEQEVCFIWIQKYISKKECNICSHLYADNLLKCYITRLKNMMSIKNPSFLYFLHPCICAWYPSCYWNSLTENNCYQSDDAGFEQNFTQHLKLLLQVSRGERDLYHMSWKAWKIYLNHFRCIQ